MKSAERVTRPSPRKRSGDCTFDDFCQLVKPHQKADLLDGIIHMASPENTDANKLYTWLYRLLGDYVEEREIGQLFSQRVAFRLSEEYGPEPDIAFVKSARLHLVTRGFVNGPPDLAI